MKVGIIGSGVIGLCSAWYLAQKGHQIVVFEKGDGSDGCSFGNMGYLSPSHFIPLASPGIVTQGLKFMLNPVSPFYIKPRLDADLMKWAYHFWRSSTSTKVAENAPALNDLLHFSRTKTIEMASELGNNFDLTLKGCYMMYRKSETEKHEIHMAGHAKKLGIETEILDGEELRRREPELGVTSLGAVFYPIDAHLHPGKWVHSLRKALTDRGVEFKFNTQITDFETAGRSIRSLKDQNGVQNPVDQLVVAAGSWLPEVVQKMGHKMLLQPGKGYSTTFTNLAHNLSRPAILVDDRVALTPFGADLRVGGTMELSGINHNIYIPRVQAIINAVRKNFTSFDFVLPPKEQLWCGLRPVSPDGLPYLGKSQKYDNVTLAGGHAMLGVSMAAGTGSVVSDLVENGKTMLKIDKFRVDRY
ncbi:MAG: FAD-dependent oxidoreductase [Saprospiraceae bacterium]|nr:FAD-dependent oxidoreductase [Saprospiraceae bacterium]